MPTLRDITAARHPLYSQYAGMWAFFHDHYEGGPDYAAKPNPLFQTAAMGDIRRGGSGRYVSQHGLEDTRDYLARLNRAACVNICQPAVDLLAGTVGSPDSVVLDVQPDYREVVDDCDLMGSSFLQFMMSCRTHAAVFGHTFILCDSTRAQSEIRTEADAIQQGIRPYFREIVPADMLSWRLDSNGKPIEILFRVLLEAPGSILDGEEKEQQYEYRFWNREQWIVYREQGKDVVIADQGPNPLGEVPVAVLYHKRIRPFMGQSLLKESAKFSQILSNWLSDLDNTMEMQSFAQAWLRSESKPSEVGLGSDRVLHLAPERKSADTTTGQEEFGYASPDPAPLQVMWDSFFRVLDMANSSMSLKPEATTDKANPESGISRAWRWHATEKKLVQMALNEQETARYLFYYAGRWKGQDTFTGSIIYGTDYDLTSLSDDIESMLALQAAGLPPTAQAELKKRAIRKALPNIDPRVQAVIDRELASMPMMAPAAE